jgi:hypothetical protein
MKTTAMAIAAYGLLAMLGAVPAAGQQERWNVRDRDGGGKRLQLRNDEGAAIVLQCSDQEVDAWFVFAEPIEVGGTWRGALVIGQLWDVVPGRFGPPRMRQSFPVAQVGERAVQIARGRGLDFTLALLGAATHIHVRTAGGRASFAVSDSDLILTQCPGAEERSAAAAGYGISAAAPAWSPPTSQSRVRPH